MKITVDTKPLKRVLSNFKKVNMNERMNVDLNKVGEAQVEMTYCFTPRSVDDPKVHAEEVWTHEAFPPSSRSAEFVSKNTTFYLPHVNYGHIIKNQFGTFGYYEGQYFLQTMRAAIDEHAEEVVSDSARRITKSLFEGV